MTYFDIGRRIDLEEIWKRRKQARGSEKIAIEKSLEKIMLESGKSRELRDRLIMAIRGDDRRAVQFWQHELWRLKQEETGGRTIS